MPGLRVNPITPYSYFNPEYGVCDDYNCASLHTSEKIKNITDDGAGPVGDQGANTLKSRISRAAFSPENRRTPPARFLGPPFYIKHYWPITNLSHSLFSSLEN